MPNKTLRRIVYGVAGLALAACGGGDNNPPPVVVVPPPPPVTPPPPPPPPPVSQQFGAGFDAAFQAPNNSDPARPAQSDVIPVDPTADPVDIPNP